MLTLPAGLSAALMGPGPDRTEIYAELWSGAPKARVATVEVLGGTVTFDRTAAVRGSCSIVLPALSALVPESVVIGNDRKFGEGEFGSGTFGEYRRRELRGLLLPLRTEIRIFWRALAPGALTWTTIPLGRFTVAEPAFSDSATDQSVTVTGFDCAADIAAAAWDVPFVITEGTNARTALIAILTNRLPGVTVAIPTTSAVVPQLIFTPGQDASSGSPWDDAAAVAAVAGWDLWVDRNGVVTAGVPADPLGGAAVWALRDTQNVWSVRQTPSASELVNTVIVYGENSGETPVVEIVRDMYGPYGVNTLGRVIAREYRSSTIKTATEAVNAGIALLRSWSALIETLEMTTFPVPHLDPGDLLATADGELELEDDVYRLERVALSLDVANPASQVTLSRRAG